MDEYIDVFYPGSKWYLVQKTGDIEYEVKNVTIALVNGTCYEPVIECTNSQKYYWWMIKELIESADIYFEGGKEFNTELRKARNISI